MLIFCDHDHRGSIIISSNSIYRHSESLNVAKKKVFVQAYNFAAMQYANIISYVDNCRDIDSYVTILPSLPR